MELHEYSIQQARDGLQKKMFSAVELTEACLLQIKKRNTSLNAFISVTETRALKDAKAADARILADKNDPLCGIPFSVKDAICTEGVRSTASAHILDSYIPPYSATAVSRVQNAGAVLIGKTNCDAFGHGASTENSMYGPVKNPFNEACVAGGSSGGSAAAVASGMSLFSIAEDTGGSIRQPAALCGVAGLRATYGRVSRYGAMAMASSLDVVGPMARTVSDIALLLEVMAGEDKHDATTSRQKVPSYTKEIHKPIRGLRIGIPKEYFELEGLDPETRDLVYACKEQLVDAGCTLVEISLPYTKYAIPVYYILVPSEDSSNMARIDGIRYGTQIHTGNDLFAMYADSRRDGLPAEVKRRIMIGTYALSAGYFDAYYKKARQVQTRIRRDFDTAFEKVDALLTPTSPFPAFQIGEKANDVLAMYLADVFVSPASVAGLPALSVPIGNTAQGLPVGLQLIGRSFEESVLFRLGNYLEKPTA